MKQRCDGLRILPEFSALLREGYQLHREVSTAYMVAGGDELLGIAAGVKSIAAEEVPAAPEKSRHSKRRVGRGVAPSGKLNPQASGETR